MQNVFAITTKQRGATLVTSLLLLLVLTVIGVSAMQVTRLQERMAGNTRDLNIAFQAAEAALRDAERTIFAAGQASNTRPARCAALGACDTVYQPDLLPPLAFQDAGWWDDNAREFAVSGTKDLQEVSADPQYVIEEIAEVGCGSLVVGDDTCNRVFYRVTARSTGTSATTQTVLQSTYAYPFDF